MSEAESNLVSERARPAAAETSKHTVSAASCPVETSGKSLNHPGTLPMNEHRTADESQQKSLQEQAQTTTGPQ